MPGTQTDHPQTTVFKLGITMAGAVTAGAYSAGVLYYLLRNLQEWEELKKTDDPSIPRHKVIIEVMGGASAGSMVTAIALMSFGLPIHEDPKNNLQYDAWVNLIDDSAKKGNTLHELLKKQDDSSGRFSLLNASFMEQLKERMIDRREALRQEHGFRWPVYVSENIQILFTLTSLNGIPVGVRFSKDNPESIESPVHYMKLHQVIAHYQRNSMNSDLVNLNLDNRESLDDFIDFAIASGAFPMGFPPKNCELSGTVLRRYLKTYFKDFDKKLEIGRFARSEQVAFTAIDGGTLNNEPFIEVRDILKELTAKKDTVESEDPDRESIEKFRRQAPEDMLKKKTLEEVQQEAKRMEQQVFDALIMIDPFPNFADIDIDTASSASPRAIIESIIGAIRGQAMIKNPERLLSFIDDERYGMIFPSRRVAGTRVEEGRALATSGIAAFGGFLSKEFRHHDFMLGMKNCQSFIRKYFGINDSEKDRYMHSFASWAEGDPRWERYAYKDKDNYRYPIIPDMRLKKPDEAKNLTRRERFKIGITEETVGEFPKIRVKDLNQFARPLRGRIFYLGKKWLFSSGKKKEAVHAEDPEFVTPYNTGIRIRKFFLLFGVLGTLGFFYWMVPIYAFWLLIFGIIILLALTVYFTVWNGISNIMASILKEYESRDQLDHSKKS